MHTREQLLKPSVEICLDGDIRLVGGMRMDSRNRSLEGRLEYCSGETWGTVCDNNFDNLDARVVCRQAGFSNSTRILILTLSLAITLASIYQMVLFLTLELLTPTDKLPHLCLCT